MFSELIDLSAYHWSCVSIRHYVVHIYALTVVRIVRSLMRLGKCIVRAATPWNRDLLRVAFHDRIQHVKKFGRRSPANSRRYYRFAAGFTSPSIYISWMTKLTCPQIVMLPTWRPLTTANHLMKRIDVIEYSTHSESDFLKYRYSSGHADISSAFIYGFAFL